DFDRLRVPGRRHLVAAVCPRLPHGTKGKNLLRHVAQDPSGRYIDSLALLHADERTALYSPDVRRAMKANADATLPDCPPPSEGQCGGSPRAAFRSVLRASAAQPHDAIRFRDLPARRRAHE